jgi:putative CocE/NonD family hydrolase
MDRWVRGIENGVEREPPVRVYLMGADTWIEADRWPLPGTVKQTLYLGRTAAGAGVLADAPAAAGAASSVTVSDPAHPVRDPFAAESGPHDYRSLAGRPDVLVFETAPLEHDMDVAGAVEAEIHLSVDAPDTDLWVKLYDVAPDGTAYNLMSPGLDVMRASYRDGGPERKLLVPGEPVVLRFSQLLTANRFRAGHRLRVALMTSFAPHFSRNLHTGALEMESAEGRVARVTIHHDRSHPSRLILPVVGPR